MEFRKFFAYLSRRGEPGPCLTRCAARRLALTRSQQLRLDAVHDTLASLREEARAGCNYQRKALLHLLEQEQLNREDALHVARAPMSIVHELLPLTVERFAEFHATLTRKQRDELRDLLSDCDCRGGHFCS